MIGFVLRRLGYSLLSLALLSVTIFLLIRLTGDPQEIDCRYEGIKGLVLRAEFVRKR